MPNGCSWAMVGIAAATSALALPAPAHASPLPDFCAPSMVVDDVCTVRLTTVTADAIDGTITGAPVGGGTAVTAAGQLDAYQKSTGFGGAPPDPIARWDSAIDSVSVLDVDPSDPNWYGNAKSRVFLPRTLDDLASQFPPDVLVVRFTPDDARPGTFRLVSIQPTAR